MCIITRLDITGRHNIDLDRPLSPNIIVTTVLILLIVLLYILNIMEPSIILIVITILIMKPFCQNCNHGHDNDVPCHS